MHVVLCLEVVFAYIIQVTLTMTDGLCNDQICWGPFKKRMWFYHPNWVRLLSSYVTHSLYWLSKTTTLAFSCCYWCWCWCWDRRQLKKILLVLLEVAVAGALAEADVIFFSQVSIFDDPVFLTSIVGAVTIVGAVVAMTFEGKLRERFQSRFIWNLLMKVCWWEPPSESAFRSLLKLYQ